MTNQKQPRWFKHESDKTATGYRWLDWLTAPYWSFVVWRSERQLYRTLQIEGESIAETKRWFREALADMPATEELLRRIEDTE